MMNQKQAVYLAVLSVLGEVSGKVNPDRETRKLIEAEVVSLFKSGEVAYDGGVPSDEKLNKYVPGLVNNWLRKDTRLNGGEKYQAKNPGIRAGSGDETMKAMKSLLAITTDPEAKAKIQVEIDKRAADIAKSKQPTVDVSKLPESLRHLAPVAA